MRLTHRKSTIFSSFALLDSPELPVHCTAILGGYIPLLTLWHSGCLLGSILYSVSSCPEICQHCFLFFATLCLIRFWNPLWLKFLFAFLKISSHWFCNRPYMFVSCHNVYVPCPAYQHAASSAGNFPVLFLDSSDLSPPLSFIKFAHSDARNGGFFRFFSLPYHRFTSTRMASQIRYLPPPPLSLSQLNQLPCAIQNFRIGGRG